MFALRNKKDRARKITEEISRGSNRVSKVGTENSRPIPVRPIIK